MRAGGVNSVRSRAMVGKAVMVWKGRVSESIVRSAWSMD
jgi:hypothetical protein